MMSGGFSQSALKDAFELVENKQNWKLPINAVVSLQLGFEEAQLKLLKEAVIHFTGSVPTFKAVTKTKIRVVAAGYYKAVGA